MTLYIKDENDDFATHLRKASLWGKHVMPKLIRHRISPSKDPDLEIQEIKLTKKLILGNLEPTVHHWTGTDWTPEIPENASVFSCNQNGHEIELPPEGIEPECSPITSYTNVTEGEQS